MDNTASYPSDVAFTPSVKAVQTTRFPPLLRGAGGTGLLELRITPDLAGFIEAQTSIFWAPRTRTASPTSSIAAAPPVSCRCSTTRPSGSADFAGNRQYITQGNLADNPKAYLFLIDYAHRQRIKLWGEARFVEGDAELTARLMPESYKARAEQVILFTVAAWDANCPSTSPAVRGGRCRRRARRPRPTHRDAGRRDRTAARDRSRGVVLRRTAADDVQAVVPDFRSSGGQAVQQPASSDICDRKAQSGRPFSAHQASTKPASAAGNSSKGPRILAAGGAGLQRCVHVDADHIPARREPGWPWQASSTSHGLSSLAGRGSR